MKKDTYYDLTNPQKSIWDTEQFYANTSISNIAGTLIIDDIVNFDLLKLAINLFIQKNDSMRIKLFMKNDEVKQYVSNFYPIDFKIYNITKDSDLESLEHIMISSKFKIIENDLFSFSLFKFANNKGGFIANLHHIISDAWTMSLLINEIMNIYSNLLNGISDYNLLKYPSYLDFIDSEFTYINSSRFQNSKEFWALKFNNELNLTYLNPNTSNSCKANRKNYSLSLETSQKIQSFCTSNKTSVFSLFMSVLGIYLSKLNNSRGAVIGTPVLNRSNFKEKNTTGMFISTIPFKIDYNSESSFINYLSNITQSQFSMFKNQKYPYNILLEDIRQEHNIKGNIFDLAFSYQNARDNKNSCNINYYCKWLFNGCVSNNIDIHIYDMDDTGILNIFYDYKIDLFSEHDIDMLHKRIMYIIKSIMSKKDILLKDIEIITPSEKQFIINNYNNTNIVCPIDKPIYKLFEEQVVKTPNNIAISFQNYSLTYKDFNSIANYLSSVFAKAGIKHKDSVCLFFNNSIELVASILGLLKLGACYIPINVLYPKDRIDYIINDSNSKLIITNSNNLSKLKNLKSKSLIIDLNSIIDKLGDCNNAINTVSSDDLAYVIYTSGSTGNPKGVKISNKSLTNYIYWANRYYVRGEKTNFPLYSSIAFDLTVTSIFTPLISGNTIYIYENSNPELLLKEIIDDNKVQIIKLTPAHLSLLQDCATSNSSIKKLIVGGDILTNETCDKINNAFKKQLHIYNEYGPTEATVGCMIYEYNQNDNYNSVPIGTPIDNTKIFILNDELNIIPFGYTGQIYIGGNCLSKGYVNLENITNDKFIKNPFQKGTQLYKTGDIAKMHSNGIIEYIGRSDFQVKINGYRIETGEIQAKILQFPNIKDCFVTVLDIANVKILCSYYVSDIEINIDSIKSFLIESLPTYMIPKYFIKMPYLPLTPNGKVNKIRLPMPNVKTTSKYIPPKTEIEKILHYTFCKLLKLDRISITDNFFDYYMDSLSIIKAQTKLYTMGYNINTQAFYEHSNIKDLANYISNHSNTETCLDVNLDLPYIPNITHNITLPNKYKNILLFGATGFLGIHILHELLHTTNCKIFCLIRKKDNINPIDRLYKKFHFYFPNECFDIYKSRINIVHGNILNENFNLPDETYHKIGAEVDCVIDGAALVKHYGSYTLFNETNVTGTQRIIDFCVKYHIPFNYISTISVSGYGLVKTKDALFTENDLYIGQDYTKNVYVRSKFEAESLIIKACNNRGLIASIYRMGNITNRYNDGYFQQNAKENAFLNRIASFINIRMCTKRNTSPSIRI